MPATVVKMTATTNAYNSYYEGDLTSEAGNTIVLDILNDENPNKGSAAEIGYSCDASVTVYGTLDKNLADTTQWVEIASGESINKTTNGLKFVSTGTLSRVIVRVISY